MPNRKINVFIVDDHNIIINGISAMLENVDDVQLIGSANTGKEAIEKIREYEPDIVLMDIKMPEMNGIETTRKLLEADDAPHVLALTMFDDEEYISSMLSAGAKGYILKNTGKEELLRAIRRANEGKSYFSSDVTNTVMERFMTQNKEAAQVDQELDSASGEPVRLKPRGSHEIKLTKRELEILKLIASEMTNQEIADKLFISPRTVHSHRRNLMQKVGVKNTVGLVRYAIEQKIV